ncbi:protein of unknown function [Paenibacillus sp. UNCCL117]|uniref:DUF4178 domain-containing protein n=1 Tax=unclassified Paenibacillus TaxID=185978 RepID=UPI0008844857|nr:MULTISPECIES: DUF4178 domain-containing protein [unclassified Paenibacillus]SDC22242.1 protein of unknown function [Paenibacillus sp. cl123]SFW18987.1 protein of unknown function [Paenibacillus sp. UNCCL117]
MSIWKRVGDIWKSNKTVPEVKASNPFEDTRVGDIVNVDLEEYIVSGKVVYYDQGYAPHRFAYYLQNGKHISCLLVEKGRTYECFVCEFVEGSLDDPADVPTELELNDGVTYVLEHNRTDLARTEGRTDFRSGDQVLIWRYIGPGENYFFLQWQDGKYVALEGERTPPGLIKFLKGSGDQPAH